MTKDQKIKTVVVKRSTKKQPSSLNSNDTPDPIVVQSPSKIMVARKVETDGEVVPMSVMSAGRKNMTPRKDARTGKTIRHTVLGDVEEYEQHKAQDESQKFSFAALHSPREAQRQSERESERRKQDGLSFEEMHTMGGGNRPPALDLRSMKQQQGARKGKGKETVLEGIEREKKEQKQEMKSMHIFERMMYTKDERALKNWEKRKREWAEMEARLAKRLGKNVDELVVSRSDEFRAVMEERELVQRAIPLVEQGPNSFWSIASSTSGIEAHIKQDEFKAITTVGKPRHFREEVHRMATTKGASHGNGGNGHARKWLDSQYLAERQKQLSKVSNVLLNHRPDFDGLEVVGVAISAQEESEGGWNRLEDSQDEYEQDSEDGDNVEWLDEDGDGINDIEDPEEMPVVDGPMIVASDTDLVFTADMTSTGTCRVEMVNIGTTAMYFEWQAVEKEVKLPTIVSGKGKFFQSETKGVIVPQSSKEFTFVFRSDTPGTFAESWQFVTMPKLESGHIDVNLRGIARGQDALEEERGNLEEYLEEQAMQHACEQLVREIVEGVKTPERSVTPEFMGEEEQLERQRFDEMNQELHVYYKPEVYNALERLYEEAVTLLDSEEAVEGDGVWNGSIASIHTIILGLGEGKSKQRGELIEILDDLVRESSMAPVHKASSLLYFIGYDLLCGLAEELAQGAEQERERMGLPAAGFMELEHEAAQESKESTGTGKKRKKARKDESANRKPTVESVLAERANWTEQRQSAEDTYVERMEGTVKGLLTDMVERFESLCTSADAISQTIAVDNMLPRDQDGRRFNLDQEGDFLVEDVVEEPLVAIAQEQEAAANEGKVLESGGRSTTSERSGKDKRVKTSGSEKSTRTNKSGKSGKRTPRTGTASSGTRTKRDKGRSGTGSKTKRKSGRKE